MLPGPSHANPPASSQPREPASELEALGLAVLKDDQKLVIWRQDSEAMWRAAHALQSLWHTAAPAVAVEHFTGQQRLAWLGHINQSIAQLGLTQAMQTPSPASLPRQISIVTHAEHLSASDVYMLENLTRHLRGLRWRWVLIGLDPSGGQSSAAMASTPPSETTPRWMAELAPAAPTRPDHPAAPAAPSALAEPRTLASIPLTTEAAASPASTQPSKRLAWLSLAVLLGLGAWGTALHFSDPNSVPSWADKRTAAVTPAAAAAAAAPSIEAPPLRSASALQPNESAASNTPPSQTKDRVASAVPAEPAAMPQAPAAADDHIDVPEIALRGVRWLTLQSPEFFVVEHGVFQTASQAQSLIHSKDELVNARVLMRKTANPGGRFVVITGPFRSQERAQNYKDRQSLAPQTQVRRVSDVLEDSVRTAPSGS